MYKRTFILTDRQTDTLIAVLRTPPGAEVITSSCCSTDSERSHRCHLSNNVQNINRMPDIPYILMGQEMPQKLSFPGGDLGPHLMHGFLSHLTPYPKRHLDLFIRFCRAHGCDQQTDRQTYIRKQTHRPRHIGINMPHLCTVCARDAV